MTTSLASDDLTSRSTAAGLTLLIVQAVLWLVVCAVAIVVLPNIARMMLEFELALDSFRSMVLLRWPWMTAAIALPSLGLATAMLRKPLIGALLIAAPVLWSGILATVAVSLISQLSTALQ